jgi:transketolase
VECWQAALSTPRTPSVIALTRQGLPTVRATHVEENLSAKGGYVLAEATGDRRVTLIATGSEVEIALAARDMLEAEGIGAAVVSMPCCEAFARQPDAYRAAVLGGGARIAIEAGVRQSWDRLLGDRGGFVGMTGFGASAPYMELYEKFGITAAHVVEAAKARL